MIDIISHWILAYLIAQTYAKYLSSTKICHNYRSKVIQLKYLQGYIVWLFDFMRKILIGRL